MARCAVVVEVALFLSFAFLAPAWIILEPIPRPEPVPAIRTHTALAAAAGDETGDDAITFVHYKDPKEGATVEGNELEVDGTRKFIQRVGETSEELTLRCEEACTQNSLCRGFVKSSRPGTFWPFQQVEECFFKTDVRTTVPGDEKTSLHTKQGGVVCVFIHGASTDFEFAITPDFSYYWGDVHKHTPQCHTRHFLRTDTVSRAFDSPELLDEVCTTIKGGDAAGPDPSDNRILFSHSAGGLMIAAALNKGVCGFGPNVRWYSAGTPWDGAFAERVLSEKCRDSRDDWGKLAQWLGVCTNGDPSPMNLSLDPEFTDFALLRRIAEDRLDGTLCGDSPLGIRTGPYSAGFGFVAHFVVKFPEDSDGAVTVSECMHSDHSLYDTDFSSPHFVGHFNHHDVTCANGGSPCAWYASRV